MPQVTHFEVSIDMFEPSCEWRPNIRVRLLNIGSNTGTCTCVEIVQKQLRFIEWKEKFTLKLICLSSASLGEAFKILPDYNTESISTLKHDVQRSMMSKLKLLCECDRKFSVRPDSEHSNEWGLLDSDLGRQEDGSKHGFINNAPVSMTYDGILRPSSLVLYLASSKSGTILRQRVNTEIERVLKAQIPARDYDDKVGYVYVLQREELPGYVKIGFSKKHPLSRSEDLQPCFKDIRVLGHSNKIANAAKVERLVHAELAYFRRFQDCSVCGKQHQEWFEVSAEAAQQVILRWSRWMAAEPYERGSGKLKYEWTDKSRSGKTDNYVSIVDRFLKTQMGKPLREVKDGQSLTGWELVRRRRGQISEVSDLAKQKIRSVRWVKVDEEMSHWYTPPREHRSRSLDSDGLTIKA